MGEIGSLRLDDTPVDGQTERGITSNWAYDEAVTRAAAVTAEAVARAAADTTHAADPDAHGNSLYPWIIDIDPFHTAKSNVNWNTISVNTAWLNNGFKYSSAAQNDSIAWDVVLAKGTWSVELIYGKDSDRGIISVQFDSVEKGTIDAYAPAPEINVRSSITGIDVPLTKKIELKLKVTSKNDSSTSYMAYLVGVRLIRTA